MILNKKKYVSTLKRLNKIGLACLTGLACLMIGCKSYEYSTVAPYKQQSEYKGVKTAWVPSARVTVTIDQQVLNTRVAMAITIDSLIIWSIQPIAGMELYRLEATPQEVTVFDKTNMTYIPLTYEQISRYSPEITFDHLQQIATGDILPMGRTSTLRSYSALGHSVILDIDYQEIRFGVPVNMNRLSPLRFEEKQLNELMK